MAETTNLYLPPEHHVLAFTTNVRASVQRMGGKLRSLVTQGSYSGEGVQAVDFIGAAEFGERSARWEDTKLSELEHLQRWLYPKDYVWATLVDKIDRLRMLYDPTSPYVEAARRGYNRREDDIIMDAFFGTSFAGKLGATQVTFPSANVIGVSVGAANSGLNIEKLREARARLLEAEVDLDMETPHIVVPAREMDNLLATTQVTSIDYNTVKALVGGTIDTFMGFKFIKIQNVPRKASDTTIRLLPVWVQSGMHVGDWENMSVIVNQRPDKNNIPQIHATFNMSATRLEEEKVFQIECKNS